MTSLSFSPVADVDGTDGTTSYKVAIDAAKPASVTSASPRSNGLALAYPATKPNRPILRGDVHRMFPLIALAGSPEASPIQKPWQAALVDRRLAESNGRFPNGESSSLPDQPGRPRDARGILQAQEASRHPLP